jgi:hypothetical protein
VRDGAGVTAFSEKHRLAQGDYLQAHHSDKNGHAGARYRLRPAERAQNLAPDIRDSAGSYFAEKGISWHPHANHGLSSQVCCLNFLMPLAHDPIALGHLIGRALGIEPPEMLPIEQDNSGRDWFVAFEWIGEADYLNEARNGKRTRGANATSTDAAVRFRHAGRIEIALIEWKFSESYGAPIPPAGNGTRIGRYREIAFAPDGPIRADLGLKLEDFFWEPFYQMLRQQMLAMRMEQARELDAEHVRVVHISPSENTALHKVTAPVFHQFGTDAFVAFAATLTKPADFVSWAIGDLFGPLIAGSDTPWAAYLRTRYALLCDGGAA